MKAKGQQRDNDNEEIFQTSFKICSRDLQCRHLKIGTGVRWSASRFTENVVFYIKTLNLSLVTFRIKENSITLSVVLC